jgi:transcriptional regulator NrdR family protein
LHKKHDYSAKLLVKKRNGRLEPFDSRKMARAVSRAGVPYLIALRISKTIKSDEQLMDKEQVTSVTLRKMVAEEMVKQHHDTAARSYLGYKKTRSTKEKYHRSHKPLPKVRKQTKSHAKQYAKDMHNISGRPPRW